ncbi:MAG: carbohydrate ABC transporter permease [Ruminococcaceae bacterium]|nr:carbohydrate ABC transporter permease [Oscillospiraceae bacterium]
MNAQNTENKPRVKRETKNKIRVEFDRTPLKERLKAKFLSFYFLQKVAITIFQLVLMIGISYIVIFPFISKITSSIMAPQDFIDVTVRLIPKNISFDIYAAIVKELGYLQALGNTFILSFSAAVIQMLICSLIGYGFAKFKFRGRNLIFVLVMITMIIPHQTLQHSMYLEFRNFDFLGIVRLLKGGGIQIFDWNIKDLGEGVAEFFGKLDVLPKQIVIGVDEYGDDIVMQFKQTGVNIAKTYMPLILLSATGLAFKNGLYIFLLRQFFRGIPDELEESAYMDGCGTFRTFVQIILPLSVPMMVTVFLFAFCWQWTDDFYVGKIIETTASNTLLVDLVGKVPPSLKLGYAGQTLYETAIRNTCGLMIIAPLVILYAFCQNFLVQGIEHSGIAN